MKLQATRPKETPTQVFSFKYSKVFKNCFISQQWFLLIMTCITHLKNSDKETSYRLCLIHFEMTMKESKFIRPAVFTVNGAFLFVKLLNQI